MTRARDLAAFVSNADGDIKFDTDTLFIDSSANRVGISTTTVNRKLEVAGNNNGGSKENYIRITDTDTSATANNQQGGIEFYTSDSGNENVTASIENLYAGSGGGSELTFNTAPNGSSGVSERMRISSDGNIGLNETNPTADIHMTKADDINEIIMDANRPSAGQLIGRHRYYWNGTEVARMEGDAGSDTTNKDDGYLRFLARASGSSIAEKLRIDSDGLKFNGDTAAANALDDYEEGSWTPAMSGVTLSGSPEGLYTKIGNLVLAQFTFSVPSTSSTSAANLSGLPFTVSGNSGAGRSAGFLSYNPSGLDLTLLVSNNTSFVQFRKSDISSLADLSGSLFWGTLLYRTT